MLADIKARRRRSKLPVADAKRLKSKGKDSVQDIATCTSQQFADEVVVHADPLLKGLLFGNSKPGDNSDAPRHDQVYDLKTDGSIIFGYSLSATETRGETEVPSVQSGKPSTSGAGSGAYRSLTVDENKLINFLETSFKTAMESNCAWVKDIPESVTEAEDFYNVAMIWCGKFLQFIKTVDDFKQLSMETKISAVKKNIRFCGLVVMAYTFEAERNCFVMQNMRARVDMFMEIFSAYRETTEKLVHIIQSMQGGLFKDPSLIAILELILIFCPAWDGLNERKHLSDLQNKYLVLLKHYIEAKYSYSRGKELFALVMQKCVELKDIIVAREEVFAHSDKDKLSYIAREFLM